MARRLGSTEATEAREAPPECRQHLEGRAPQTDRRERADGRLKGQLRRCGQRTRYSPRVSSASIGENSTPGIAVCGGVEGRFGGVVGCRIRVEMSREKLWWGRASLARVCVIDADGEGESKWARNNDM